MDKVLLSIVVPMYNASKTIERCLNSILACNCTLYEIIIIDDFSKDNSVEIVNRIKKNHEGITLYKNDSNRLPGKCRNKGMEMALGKFIWFVDADDWIEKDAIKRIIDYVSVYKSVQVIGVGVNHIISKDKIITSEHSLRARAERSFSFEYFLKFPFEFPCPPWAYVYRKDYLMANQLLFPNGVYYEDLLFQAKALYFVNYFGIIPEASYNYDTYASEGSITQSFSSKKIFDLVEGFERIVQFLKKQNTIEKYKNLLEIYFVLHIIPNCFLSYQVLKEEERKDKDLTELIKRYYNSNELKENNLNKLYNYIKHDYSGLNETSREKYLKVVNSLMLIKQFPNFIFPVDM